MSHRLKSFLPLGLILLMALLIRLPGMWWGDGELVPGQLTTWNTDEYFHVRVARQFTQGPIDHDSNYVKAFGLQMAGMAGLLQGSWSGLDSDQLIRGGRWVSLCYGVGLVLLAFVTVRDAFRNRPAALLTAAMVALSSLVVVQSHLAVADMASTFWVWMAAWLTHGAITSRSRWRQGGAWAACTLAISTKLALAAVGPLIYLLVTSREKQRDFLLGLVVGMALFFPVNGFAIGPEGFLAIWDNVLSDSIQVIPRHSPLETLATIIISLAPGLSFPVVAAAGVGLWAAVKKGKEPGGQGFHQGPWLHWGCFGTPVLIHFGLLLLLDDPFERHLLPLVPVFCGLAAFGWIHSLPKGWSLPKQLLATAPLIAYLLFFAIDGERPFWNDSRILARQWILQHAGQGSSILQGRYAYLALPKERFRVTRQKRRDRSVPRLDRFDWIILHEVHTYRYRRSRLSPFGTPDRDNIYHPDLFGVRHLDALWSGVLPFRPVQVIPMTPPLTLERILYRRYWGPFQSFVGDVVIYRKMADPFQKQDRRFSLGDLGNGQAKGVSESLF
ncbi:MAG: glycosyltransferase family 39 protein [Magnetococcales bacterium]|nr:glycosyltransferase family 39 protein [Magnetococcales bacterium]